MRNKILLLDQKETSQNLNLNVKKLTKFLYISCFNRCLFIHVLIFVIQSLFLEFFFFKKLFRLK